LAIVNVDDARDVMKISSADVPDAKISKMLKRAEVALGLSLEKIKDNRIDARLARFVCPTENREKRVLYHIIGSLYFL
jgi:hypothetical protein